MKRRSQLKAEHLSVTKNVFEFLKSNSVISLQFFGIVDEPIRSKNKVYRKRSKISIIKLLEGANVKNSHFQK